MGEDNEQRPPPFMKLCPFRPLNPTSERELEVSAEELAACAKRKALGLEPIHDLWLTASSDRWYNAVINADMSGDFEKLIDSVTLKLFDEEVLPRSLVKEFRAGDLPTPVWRTTAKPAHPVAHDLVAGGSGLEPSGEGSYPMSLKIELARPLQNRRKRADHISTGLANDSLLRPDTADLIHTLVRPEVEAQSRRRPRKLQGWLTQRRMGSQEVS